MTLPTLEICVIAHNEEKHISSCLDSITTAIRLHNAGDINVHIINNGSNDRTQHIVDVFCKSSNNWFAHELTLGDKANAWNYGLYECVKNSKSQVIFIDGDCRISPSSISALVYAQSNNPQAYILAGSPALLGKTSMDTLIQTLDGKALSGANYSITSAFHQKIKARNFRLPTGLIGDDSLLAWVSSHNFSLKNGSIPGFLIGVPNAIYYYHRLTPNSWSNIKLYIRRLRRYSLRHLQQNCIREFLELHDDFAELPETIDSIYNLYKPAHCRTNNLINFIFDHLAAYQLKQLSTRT